MVLLPPPSEKTSTSLLLLPLKSMSPFPFVALLAEGEIVVVGVGGVKGKTVETGSDAPPAAYL